jgi:hypothetical protein
MVPDGTEDHKTTRIEKLESEWRVVPDTMIIGIHGLKGQGQDQCLHVEGGLSSSKTCY